MPHSLRRHKIYRKLPLWLKHFLIWLRSPLFWILLSIFGGLILEELTNQVMWFVPAILGTTALFAKICAPQWCGKLVRKLHRS